MLWLMAELEVMGGIHGEESLLPRSPGGELIFPVDRYYFFHCLFLSLIGG